MTIPLKQALVTIFNSNGSPCQFRLRILIRPHNNVITDVHIYICESGNQPLQENLGDKPRFSCSL